MEVILVAGIGFIDYVVLALYFLSLFFISFYSGKKVSNISDFATGGSSYGTFFILATTASAFIGGGFTMGLAEKTFSLGVWYILALWGFSIKEILVGIFIAPRIRRFTNALSVGEIMGKLYGKPVRIFTGVASVLVCGGIAGAQFSGFGYVAQILLQVPQEIGAIFGAMVVILYSANGGIKSVVANDVLHFCVLIIAIPLVFILSLIDLGGLSALSEAGSYYYSANSNISYIGIFGLFLSFFFGETLVPPYVQRLLIGKTATHTVRGTIASGLLSIPFFLIVGLIGIIAHGSNPDLNPNMAMPYVIAHVMPVGIKGLAIGGLMAVLMSSADSFLNAAAVSASRDVVSALNANLNGKQELVISRIMTILVGVIGLIFAVSVESVIEILLKAYNFWTPMILVPLVAGILGYKASQTIFWLSAFAGAATVGIMNFAAVDSYGIDYAVFGVISCSVIFFGSSLILERHKHKRVTI